jgi:hypothetical protein
MIGYSISHSAAPPAFVLILEDGDERRDPCRGPRGQRFRLLFLSSLFTACRPRSARKCGCHPKATLWQLCRVISILYDLRLPRCGLGVQLTTR